MLSLHFIFKLTAINDPAIDIDYICYLIKFDSTHGKFRGNITHTDNEIIIDGKNIQFNVIKGKIITVFLYILILILQKQPRLGL